MSLFMRWHKLLRNDSKRDSAFAIFVFPLGIVIFVAMTAVIYEKGGILPIILGNGILAAIVIASAIGKRMARRLKQIGITLGYTTFAILVFFMSAPLAAKVLESSLPYGGSVIIHIVLFGAPLAIIIHGLGIAMNVERQSDGS